MEYGGCRFHYEFYCNFDTDHSPTITKFITLESHRTVSFYHTVASTPNLNADHFIEIRETSPVLE